MSVDPSVTHDIVQVVQAVAMVGGSATLSKPAITLIEKLSSTLGIVTNPWQIRRNARAEADGLISKAKAEIEIVDLQQRAELRRKIEVVREQQNIEEAVYIAVQNIAEGARPEDIDDDWLAGFFDKCRLVSNEEIQKLWGQVLAGEANNPGTFSPRTLTFLSTLTKDEALSFRNYCSHNWQLNNKYVTIYLDEFDGVINHNVMPYHETQHLISIGLVTKHTGYNDLKYDVKELTLSYNGVLMNIVDASEHQHGVRIGRLSLSKVGEELATICKPEYDECILEYTLNIWMRYGYIVSCPLKVPKPDKTAVT